MKVLNTRIKVQFDDNSVAELEAIGTVTEGHRKSVEEFTKCWKVLSMLPYCDKRTDIQLPVKPEQKEKPPLTHIERAEIAISKLPQTFTKTEWIKCFKTFDERQMKRIDHAWDYDIKILLNSNKVECIKQGGRGISAIYKIIEKVHNEDERLKALEKTKQEKAALLGTFK